LNIVWALVVILASVWIVVGTSTAIGVKYYNFNLFVIPVYAQPSNNATSLPPVQMQPVEPNSTVTSTDNSTGYVQYDDSDIGFKLEYPSDWDAQNSGLTNNAVVSFSPPASDMQVNVKVFPRINSESLKSFGDTFFKKSNDMKISEYYRNSTTLLGGQPAIRAVATFLATPNYFESLRGEQSTTQKILAMTTLLKDKKSFLQLIYYADKSNFMDYLPQVEHMIKSFQFQNTKPIIQEED
jgi:hypothetical protein